MLAWLVMLTAVGGTSVQLSWNGDHSHVDLVAEEGFKINPEGPLHLEMGHEDYLVSIDAFGGPEVPFGDARGAHIEGRASVSVCTLDGVTCTVESLVFAGDVPDVRKGRVDLHARPLSVEAHASEYQTDADAVFQAALAQGEASGKPVLVDFGAIWCPPCNAMSAEVLDAADRPAILEDVVLVKIDVDDHRSWGVKDRYDVGGYPTMVMVDADGNEVDRQLGYPGREGTVAWLVEAVGMHRGERVVPDLQTATPEQAAAEAFRRVSRDLDDPMPWLERAAEAPENPDYRVAAINVAPNLADARWLVAHAPDRALEWVFVAMDSEELAPVVLDAVNAALPTASGFEAADLLYVAARLSPEDAGTLYGAALAVQREAMSGDPVGDRGYWGWLADLYRLANRPEEAVAVYDLALSHYPEEPSWFLGKARLLMKLGRPAKALETSTVGLQFAWGDNHLRMAAVHTEALLALERNEEAVAFVASVLANTTAPQEGVHVRTHRYRQALASLIAPEKESP